MVINCLAGTQLSEGLDKYAGSHTAESKDPGQETVQVECDLV